MIDKEDFAAIMWTLGMISLITASTMVWGLPGMLFSFGGLFVSWVAFKQFLSAIKRF